MTGRRALPAAATDPRKELAMNPIDVARRHDQAFNLHDTDALKKLHCPDIETTPLAASRCPGRTISPATWTLSGPPSATLGLRNRPWQPRRTPS